jgi:hypothetical protein
MEDRYETLKNEYGRHKKVINLIEALAKKPNWHLQLVLCFIREIYETDTKYPTVRRFCDNLQSTKSGLHDAILARSCTFTH